MDRRRSTRISACFPFEVYCRNRRVGRFLTCNVGQGGLFLITGSISGLDKAILDLRFDFEGVAYRLRGVVVHHVQGRGVGIQLAYWRRVDRQAHLAYLEYTASNRLSRAA